jgi:hypothetical protein
MLGLGMYVGFRYVCWVQGLGFGYRTLVSAPIMSSIIPCPGLGCWV